MSEPLDVDRLRKVAEMICANTPEAWGIRPSITIALIDRLVRTERALGEAVATLEVYARPHPWAKEQLARVIALREGLET